MLITVTGATGLIGGELLRLLSAQGLTVRAITRDASRATAHPGVAWVQADLSDPAVLEPVLAGTSRLFLLTDNRRGFADLQIGVIDAARRLGVEHVVKLSALGASDHSKSGIGLAHWQAEEALRSRPDGPTWTLLRPHAFMQNWLGELARTVRAEGRIYSPVGDGRVPYIDARDIAAVATEVLRDPTRHEGRTYVLTGPEAVGMTQVAEAISAATGQDVSYHPISPEQAAERMRAQGIDEGSIRGLLALAAYQRAGGATARVSEDVTKVLGRPARDVIGFAYDYADRFTA